MALLSMLLKNGPFLTKFQDGRPIDPSRPADLFVVQATMRESSVRTVEVTEYPVEDGTEGTDHAVLKPLTYSIEGKLSETPLNIAAQVAGLTAAAGIKSAQVIGGFKGAESVAGFAVGASGVASNSGKLGGKLLGDSDDPFKVVLDGLINIAENRRIITIVSKHEKFDNMILSNLQINRDQTTGRAVRFTAEARQLQIATAETITLQKVARSAAHSAGGKQNNGKQNAKPSNEDESKKSSLLYKAAKSFGLVGG